MGPAAAMLPGVARWGFLLHALLAFSAGLVLTLVPSFLLLARARLGTSGLHWTEKARRLAPARLVIVLGQFFYPILIGGVAYSSCDASWRFPPKLDAIIATLAAFAGASLAASIIGKRLLLVHDFPPVRSKSSFRYHLSLVPFVASYGIVVWGQPNDPDVALLVDGFALVLLVTSMMKALSLRRLCGVAHPAGERLTRAVEVASTRMGLQPPRAYEMALQLANAFAFTFERAIAFTTGALYVLSDEEIVCIACHEIAHLHEGSSSRWLRLLTPVAALIFFAVIVGDTDPLVLVTGYVAVIAIWTWTRKRKVTLEKRADAAGSHHQSDAGVYALALLKLYRANLYPAAAKRAGTHPMLYDRLLAAGITPDFPRPKPPAFRAAWCIAALTVTVLLWAALQGQGRR